MKIVAVIQARMGSTRLPGKVMKRLGKASVPVILHIYDAASWAPGVDEVVVATSTNPENDVIATFCHGAHIKCIRGSEEDVLSRYIKVINETGADAVVRLTGDCPLHDPHVIGDVVALFKANHVDYACNTEPPTWPDGMDVEVISSTALRTADKEATRKTDRETVTRFIVRNRNRFPAVNLTCPINLSKERWVLDSPADAVFMIELWEHKTPGMTRWQDIWEILNKYPHIRQNNAHLSRNERFFEDLTNEKTLRTYSTSNFHIKEARKIIPLGAQTFSKSYLQYGEDAPLFASHGDGAYLYDIDGNDYVDMVSALLPVVLGYRDRDVDYAIRNQMDSGITHSLATDLEYKLASKLVQHIPCAEMVRFAKNGSDVTSAAVRLARAYTKRNVILTQGYHGWHEWTVEGTPRGRGTIRTGRVYQTDPGLLDLDRLPPIGGVIVEPDYWTPSELRQLKHQCAYHGAVLIFDEVITGFRWSIGGYQKSVGVTPDLACFGKAIANGMPLSAVVGRADIMKLFEPPDNIFCSGTFFGEALSLAAGIATIEKMEREPVIQHLWDVGTKLMHGARLLIKQHNLEEFIKITSEAPLARLNFYGNNQVSADQIKAMFIREMANEGVLIIASHNVTYAHRDTEVRVVLSGYDEALSRIARAVKADSVPAAEAMVRLRNADP